MKDGDEGGQRGICDAVHALAPLDGAGNDAGFPQDGEMPADKRLWQAETFGHGIDAAGRIEQPAHDAKPDRVGQGGEQIGATLELGGSEAFGVVGCHMRYIRCVGVRVKGDRTVRLDEVDATLTRAA